MRALAVVVGLAACHGAPTRMPERAAEPRSLAEIAPLMAPEHTTWNVFVGSLQVGRAELQIDARAARSAFRTNALASVIEPMRYDLVTPLDRATARERLTRGGRTSEHDLAPSASLHAALGIVRAWSLHPQGPGYLWLEHQGDAYRLDVFPPERDDLRGLRAIRIPGVVRSRDGTSSLDVELWLAANADRTVLRLVVGRGTSRVSAEVAESTGSFE